MYLEKTVDWDSIICSIDVGNSYSSVSFLYARRGDLFKNLKDKVYRVNSWPGNVDKSFGVPSRLCYLDRRAIKYGYNAARPGRRDRKWVLVEFFKRHVNSLGSNDVSYVDRGNLDPLPDGVTLHQIYKDWITYLFDLGSQSFRAANAVPDALWKQRLCVFVAPNGWNEPEQANVRGLIHQAKCVEDPSYVRFARESEADLHYGLFLGLDRLSLPLGLSFLICNVGSSTGDIGFYKITSERPLHYVEVKPAESFPVGQMVDEDIVAANEENGKDDLPPDEEDMDPVDNVINHVGSLCDGVSEKPKFIVLEGGCGSNPRARERIAKELKPKGITVLTLFKDNDAPSNSGTNVLRLGLPTVDGALYSCVYNFITARRAPYHFGSSVSVPYDKRLLEHNRRKGYGLHFISGKYYVPYAFETILPLGALIKDGDSRNKEVTVHFGERPHGVHPLRVVLYATKEENPEWVFEGHGKCGKRLVPDMREICKMTVDLDMNYIDIEETLLANRQTSYKLNCIIAVNFGSITSRATVSWKKKDNTWGKQSAAFIPPDNTGVEWNTNEHQGDRNLESVQSPQDEQHGHPEPTQPEGLHNGGNTSIGDKEPQYKPDVPPSQSRDPDRANIGSGQYVIFNPGNDRGYAYWDERKTRQELQCRKNNDGAGTKWIIDFDEESSSFTIAPLVGNHDRRKREGDPQVGFKGDPYASQNVFAWQTRNSGGRESWYATRAKGRNEYYIRSMRGKFAWTVDNNTTGNDEYLQVTLQMFDQNNQFQIWSLQHLN